MQHITTTMLYESKRLLCVRVMPSCCRRFKCLCQHLPESSPTGKGFAATSSRRLTTPTLQPTLHPSHGSALPLSAPRTTRVAATVRASVSRHKRIGPGTAASLTQQSQGAFVDTSRHDTPCHESFCNWKQ
jgi:hypothetical protein